MMQDRDKTKEQLLAELAAARQHIDELATLKRMVEGTISASDSEDFFRSLVRLLAATFQARFAFVSELSKTDENSVRFFAFWEGTDFGEPLEFNLKGTPCGQVIAGNGLYHTTQAQKDFPRFSWLQEKGIESYLGFPVHDAQGSVGGHLGVFHDGPITRHRHTESILKVSAARAGAELARRQMEATLASKEQLYRTLVEKIPEVIWFGDASGQVTFLNPAWYAMTGRTPEASLGTEWAEALHPEDRSQVVAQWERAYKYGESLRGECRFRGHDGSYRMVHFTGTPVRDRHNTITNWVGIDRDITERKLLEQEREKALTDLREANHELGTFAYSVSHDLRAPLRVIDAFSKDLVEDYYEVLGERGARDLQRVRDNAQLMSKLIEGIAKLSLLTTEPLHERRVDLTKLAHRIGDELRVADPDRDADFLIEDRLVVRGDPQLLEVAVRNLLNNAWKFTAPRSTARIEMGQSNVDDGKAFFIRDNGVGFDMSYSDKLFDVFQRLHAASEFEGTGIGLETVQRIIHRHGGEIWAEGQVGKGATFYFQI